MELGLTATKPIDPYYSEVGEQSIKTRDIHCKNIYISVSDGEENLLDALPVMSEQVNLLSESLTALREKYLALEDALGQQHEHTASTAVRANVVNATCTSPGFYDEVVHCATCGEEMSRVEVTTSATGHTDSNGDGYCDSCGAMISSDELQIIEGVTTPVSIPKAKEIVFLKFVPQNTGKYAFESLDMASYDPDGYVYNYDKTSALASDGNFGAFSVVYDFTAGTTYYLGVRLYSGTGTVNVKVYYNGSSSGGSTETKDITFNPSYGDYKIVRNGTETIDVYESDGSTTLTFNIGDSLELTYMPDSGYVLGTWYGDNNYSSVLSHSNPCTIPVDSSTTSYITNTGSSN